MNEYNEIYNYIDIPPLDDPALFPTKTPSRWIDKRNQQVKSAYDLLKSFQILLVKISWVISYKLMFHWIKRLIL